MRGRVRTATAVRKRDTGRPILTIIIGSSLSPSMIFRISRSQVRSIMSVWLARTPDRYTDAGIMQTGAFSIARVCMLTCRSLLSTFLRYSLHHRCPAVKSYFWLPSLPPFYPTLVPPNYEQRARARLYQRYYMEHSAVYEGCPSIPQVVLHFRCWSWVNSFIKIRRPIVLSVSPWPSTWPKIAPF